MRRSVYMSTLLALLAGAGAAAGQVHEVRARVDGLECTSCAGSLEKRLMKLKAVEEVAIDPVQTRVRIKTKPNEVLDLGELYDLVQRTGFPVREFEADVSGQLEAKDGTPAVRIGADRYLLLEGSEMPGRIRTGATVALTLRASSTEGTRGQPLRWTIVPSPAP